MGTTIRGDHIVDLVVGNWHPFAVDFDFVVVAEHATLGRATIHQVAARALAIVSLEIRVEVLMPFIVAGAIISFLRCYAYTQKHGERAREKRYEVASTYPAIPSNNPLKHCPFVQPDSQAPFRRWRHRSPRTAVKGSRTFCQHCDLG